MNTLREAAQQALAFTMRDFASLRDFEASKAVLHDNLRAALAQKDEPVWMHPWPPVRAQQDEPQTLDEAMQQPRAMAQAYENGYKAGEANEREACAKACERYELARSAAAAIRARGNT